MTKLKLKDFFYHQVFLKYALTGAVVTGLELILLYSLVGTFQWWYIYASSLTFFAGLVASFLLRKVLVFRNRDWSALPRQLFFYSLIWLINIAMNAGLMYVLVDWLLVKYLVAQVISNMFLGIFGFLFNKLITFKNFPKARVRLQHHQLLEEISKH